MGEHPSVRQRRRELEEAKAEIGERTKEFLALLEDSTRWIPTPELRRELGMSSHQVRYRRDKLQNLGLILVDDGTTDTDRTPPKVHRLSEKGAEFVDSGLLEREELPRPGTFNEVANRLQTLEGRYDELEERFTGLEEELQETKGTVQELTAAVGERQTDVDDDLGDLEERVDKLQGGFKQLAEHVENLETDDDSGSSGFFGR